LGSAEHIHRLLSERGETMAVAESLTGGLVCATLVDVPGASATFRGGLIVYATDLKASLAGVSAALLADQGPVDGEVAVQLAEGARRRCGADWGLATTGVAGPEPQGGQPAGTVWIGIAGPAASPSVAGPAASPSVAGPVAPPSVAGPAASPSVAGPAAPQALAGPGARRARLLALSGSRAEIRSATVTHALALFIEALTGSPAVPAGPESAGESHC
jgi:nicotinamide-nucleotide amidase